MHTSTNTIHNTIYRDVQYQHRLNMKHFNRSYSNNDFNIVNENKNKIGLDPLRYFEIKPPAAITDTK